MEQNMKINGKDPYEMWGVTMGEGFLETIYAPDALKEFVENKSRLEHGKQVLYNDPRLDEREVTLNFYIEGEDKATYLKNLRGFKEELQKGLMEIYLPQTDETYRLTYQKSAGFALNNQQTFSKLSVKFNEPNPAHRS